jgi:hypothetical protein
MLAGSVSFVRPARAARGSDSHSYGARTRTPTDCEESPVVPVIFGRLPDPLLPSLACMRPVCCRTHAAVRVREGW